MSDYRIKISVRNARLLRAIEAEGFRSVAAFCRAWELSEAAVNSLLCFRQTPLDKAMGTLKSSARDLCDALAALPEDLWTEDQLTFRVKKNTRQLDISADVLQSYLEYTDAHKLIAALKDKAKLTERERRVIKKHVEGDSYLEEIADELGVSRERVWQIEKNAFRKLRHFASKDPEIYAELEE